MHTTPSSDLARRPSPLSTSWAPLFPAEAVLQSARGQRQRHRLPRAAESPAQAPPVPMKTRPKQTRRSVSRPARWGGTEAWTGGTGDLVVARAAPRTMEPTSGGAATRTASAGIQKTGIQKRGRGVLPRDIAVVSCLGERQANGRSPRPPFVGKPNSTGPPLALSQSPQMGQEPKIINGIPLTRRLGKNIIRGNKQRSRGRAAR